MSCRHRLSPARIAGPLAILLSLAFQPGLAPRAESQGLPTATLTGRVAAEGAGLPGVSVTARSAGLQGARTVVTSASGDWALPNLPPGDYVVTFALSGFEQQTRNLRLGASQSSSLDVTLALTGVAAETVVTASRSDVISESTSVATTYTTELLGKLPTARTIDSAVNMAPGANTNGPRSEWSISGAMSFENLWMVNGAVVQDNIRAGAYNLFIEDAIQETTIQTSGVSAEFGRFQGGVINAITKSGGNTFSGSFRTSLTNDGWAAATPLTVRQANHVNPRYEATLGGPLWKDRIWFFGAGRLEDLEQTSQTVYTNIPYTSGSKERRYEGKLTLTPFANQTLTASYLGIKFDEIGNAFRPPLDLSTIDDRKLPEDFLVANWTGLLTPNLFGELQFSRRQFTFDGSGANTRDLIAGTPVFDQSRFPAAYNSPFFCGVCDPEKRDNQDFLVKGTWFLSTPKAGSHTIVFGYDNFDGKVRQNNFQSGSDYIVYATATLLEPSGIYPVLDPGTAIAWYPIEQLSKGTNMRTHSAFVNDQVRLGDRLSLNLGVRWDKNDSVDSRGAQIAKDQYFSPRLGATWSATRNGTLQVRASYARYVAALSETIGNSASNAGTPSLLYWYYDGPGADPINSGNGPLVDTATALRRLFDWFAANGCPGPDCQVPLGGADVPGVNTQIRGGLRSPHTDEAVLGFGGTFRKLTWRADLVHRDYRDFYTSRTDLSTGQVLDALGRRYDLGLQENSNVYERRYDAFQMQFAARPLSGLAVGGNWTWARTRGNLNGENTGTGPLTGDVTQYPEYLQLSWRAPVGDLATDQRHKVRLYASWDVPLPSRFGSLTFGAIHQLDTGTPYGAVGSAFAARYVTNPGYATPPRSESYYFTARDAFRTDTINRTDLSLQYAVKLGPAEFFLQPQVLNVFNNQGVIAVGTDVRDATNTGSLARFNPFTQTPVAGVNWAYGDNFGRPSGPADYQSPRTFRVSAGIRF